MTGVVRLLPVVLVLVLSACRLDVAVLVDVDTTGTGTVTVTATADPELVRRLPELADRLSLDDLDGWEVEGPAPTDGGGLTVVLSTDVSSADELATALARIGPPLRSIGVAHDLDEMTSALAVEGTLRLDDGFADFADEELIEVLGGLPFDDLLEDVDPAEAMTFTMTIAVPGEPLDNDGEIVAEETYRWQAPLDGTERSVTLATFERLDPAPGWAGPVSTLAFLIFIIWVAVSIAVIILVVLGRRQRARRRSLTRST